jgi:hypothetical protein
MLEPVPMRSQWSFSCVYAAHASLRKRLRSDVRCFSSSYGTALARMKLESHRWWMIVACVVVRRLAASRSWKFSVARAE